MYSEKYSFATEDCKIAEELGRIKSGIGELSNAGILKKCFSLMDLTTLHSNDTVESVKSLVDKVNRLKSEWPSYPLPASVCVFSNFASTVKSVRADDALHVTTVSACFPSSQSFLEVKLLECRMAVENGADEVDIVLNLGAFFAADYETASEEIRQIRKTIDIAAAGQGRTAILKVILETGVLRTPSAIAEASFLAMEAGADFIKTSTGKVDVNATPEAALIMCKCISAFYEKTGHKVGFKAAGGISSAEDALYYYAIGKSVLGEEWMNASLFRFGVSRLGNSLMSSAENSTVSYF